ncbi:MAG TPA: hypothetical protein VJW76_14480 [Verrucomicrobiae bacterium]|nr:hypothetical protein [Verrucomicrobiae bacterium]
MHEVLTKSQIELAGSEAGGVFSIVVAYEDTVTRDQAIILCDHLVGQLWEDFEFEASWLRFDYLADPCISADATFSAAGADMVIFSAHAGRELPQTAKSWIDSWVVKRNNRDGVLVSMIGGDSTKEVSPTHLYLRAVAKHARMDYLSNVTEVSETISGSIGAVHRDENVIPATDRFLQQGSPPSHWGINE